METIRVGVVGATGKMGREILKAVTNDPATEVIFGVGLVDEPTTITVEGREIPVTADLDAALSANDVDVVIDFTNADAFRQNASVTLAHGVHLVSGTTGLKHEELEKWGEEAAAQGKCFFYAANFAIGAVLMMRFAEEAAKFMPEVEIIELHHDQKKDAPSGTAVATAQRIAKVREAHECRRHAHPQCASAGLQRASGSDLRRPRPDADDPPRFDQPRILHARHSLCDKARRRTRWPGGRARHHYV